jgi:hypothetical protein
VSTVIEPASSGRAKCRACGRGIQKGELRAGEVVPNPFGEGDATYWFHVRCAACMRPEALLDALSGAPSELSEREWLFSIARAAVAHPRLSRLHSVSRAPSGRAQCRQCHELIDKAEWRIGLSMFEDGRFSPIGFIHLACAAPYFETDRIVDRLRHFASELAPADLSEVTRAFAPESAPSECAEPRLAKTGESQGAEAKRDAG